MTKHLVCAVIFYQTFTQDHSNPHAPTFLTFFPHSLTYLKYLHCRLKLTAERVTNPFQQSPQTTARCTAKRARAAVNTAMMPIQSWQHYELCGFSPLQAQFPSCLFSWVSIQNDKLVQHFPPRASEIELGGLLLFQCMIVIWVWAKHPGSDKGVWCQGLLCVPLFVWGSQSVCRVPCSCFPPPYEYDSDSQARSKPLN